MSGIRRLPVFVAALAALALAAGGAWWLARDDASGAASVGDYYREMRITAWAGPDAPQSLGSIGTADAPGVIISAEWVRDSRHTRTESETRAPGEPTIRSLLVRNGEYGWSHEEGTDFYSRTSLDAEEAARAESPLTAQSPLGFRPMSRDDLLSNLRDALGDDAVVEVTGADSLDAKTVTVIEFGADPPLPVSETAIGLRSGTLWYDEESRFVLKADVETLQGIRTISEILVLRLDQEFDDALFTFVPPEGAEVVEFGE